MADITNNEKELASRLQQYVDWLEESEIYATVDPEDLTAEQFKTLEELHKLASDTDGEEGTFVWTQHGTCENETVSEGVHLLGDIPQLDQKAGGCGCYQVSQFYLGSGIPFEDFIPASFFRICPKCDPTEEKWNEGEGEGDPNCELCYGDIQMQSWFDDLVSMSVGDDTYYSLPSKGVKWEKIDVKKVLGHGE